MVKFHKTSSGSKVFCPDRSAVPQGRFCRIAIFFLLLYSLAGSLKAQVETLGEPWRWVKFTTEEGLPSNRVYQVIETPSGIVWANTSEGLAWYDGFYWHPAGKNAGLVGQKLDMITETEDQDLLVVHQGKLYQGNTEGFRRIPIRNSDGKEVFIHSAVPFNHKKIMMLMRGSQSQQEKLCQYSNNYLKVLDIPSPISADLSPRLWKTKSGAIWVSAEKGLYRWDQGQWKLWLKSKSGMMRVLSLAENESGTGLAAIGDPRDVRGLWGWNPGTPPGLINRGENDVFIISADIGPENDFICLYDSGDLRIQQGHKWFTISTLPPGTKNSLFVKFRKNGDLWVGTEWGLYLHKGSTKRWTYWKHPFADARNRIHEIIQAKDGSIWVASAGGIEVHKPDGSVRHFSEIKGQKLYAVTGLAQDRDGNIWISSGSFFQGAYRWNGQHWRYFGVKDGLGAAQIHKIVNDRQGRLWFLGLSEPANNSSIQGPGAYVLEGGRFIRWGVQEGLIHGRVYAFAEGLDGARWFGTFGGLSRWKDGQWRYWSKENGLKENRIFALAVDSTNRVWFADQVNGLGYLNRSGQPEYITTDDELVSNEVWGIRVGRRGDLWVSTSAGLNLFYQGIWSRFKGNSGLNYLRLWPILPLDNRVFIGTVGSGVNILNLAEEKVPPPKILISQPNYKKNNVTLQWRVLSYWGEQQPGEIEVRYHLDQEKWSKWTTNRQVNLLNLERGTHYFEIQAKGLFGQLTRPLQWKVVIPPPFYLLPIFYLPFAFLVLTLLLLAVLFFLRKRKQEELLRKSEEKYREIFENANDIIYTHDLDGNFLSINKIGEKVSGYTVEQILAMNISQIISADYLQVAKAMTRKKFSENIATTYELEIIARDGKRVPLEVSSRLVREKGKVVAVQGIARDIRERKLAEIQIQKSLREKEILLKEIHHRVKNNLQIISSLLNLQNDAVDDPMVLTVFKESQNRIRTMALIHEKLYQSEDLAKIDFSDYIRNLADYLLSSYAKASRRVELKINAEKIHLSVDKAIPCGLILNELLSNALKHAFSEGEKGKIVIDFGQQNGGYQLIIKDDGKGIPKEVNLRNSPSLGLQLVNTLTNQLNGRIRIVRKNGTRIYIKFPYSESV